MPRKIKNVTRDYIVNVPLPNHADTYTVISHESIIDYAFQELTNQGFGIVEEEYRCTADGQIAQGIYKLQYNSDPELSLMFAWANSYNKQMRFKCAVGTYINNNGAVMIAGDMGSYNRKHTGSADVDTVVSMRSQITNAMMYYDQLVDAKNEMKEIQLTDRRQAEILGILFAEYEVLTTEQASFVRNQLTKPSFFYNGGKNTLWAFYNHVTLALQQSHPRTWMEDQRVLHFVLIEELDTPGVSVSVVGDVVTTVDPLYAYPGQTNILDQIDELERAQYPLTPDDAFQTEAAPEPTEQEIASADKEWGIETPAISAEVTDPKVSDAFIGMDEDFEMMREAFMEDLEDGEYEDDVIASEVSIVIPEDKTFAEAHEEAMIEKVEEDTKVLEAMVWETEVTEEQEPFAWEGNSVTPTPEDHVAMENELKLEEEKEDTDFFDFDLDFKDDDDSNGSNLFL